MTLRKRVVEFPLTGGIDTKKSGKTVQPPTMLELRNGRYQAEGRIDKRFGYNNLGINLSSGSLTSSTQSVVGFRDELLMFTSDHLYSYSPNDSKWYLKGEATAAKSTLLQISDSDSSATGIDAIINGGIYVTVWIEGTTYYYSVIDVNTKNRIKDKVSFKTSASTVYPRLVNVGDFVVIFYNDGGDLKWIRIPAAGPNDITSGTLYDTLDTDGVFEVDGLDNYCYVFFREEGNTTLRLSKVDIDMVIIESNTITGQDPVSHDHMAVNAFFSSGAATNYIALGWVTDTGDVVKASVFNASLDPQFSPVTIESSVADISKLMISVENSTQSAIKYFYTVSDATTTDYLTRVCSMTSLTVGTIGTPAVFLRSVGLASRAAQIEGISYFNMLFDSTLQPTYFTVDSSAKIVAKFAANGGGSHAGLRRLSNLTAMPSNDNELIWGCLRKGRIRSENATLYATTSPQIAILSLDPVDRPPTARMQDDLLIGGSVLAAYDGQSVTEYGFNVYPETLTVSYDVHGSVADGTYLVYSIYSWTDAQGIRYQSAPGQATATVVGPDDQIIVSIPALRLTSKTSDLGLTDRSAVKIKTYITELGGTVPYLIDETDNPDILANDSITVTISSIPGDITSREILYTAGGELENIAAPAHSYLFTHGNRPVLVGLENRSQIAFGKDIKPLTGVGFHEDFVLTMDPLGGDCVAGASMDTSMVIFKESATYVITGAGPNDLGEGATFSVPQLISSDIGCRDPKSVLQTPQGIVFMSNKGIYILTRALSLDYIGAPVEAYNDVTVLATHILTTTNEIRFLTNSDITLVYNYYFKRWGIYDTANAVSATTWQESGYVYLTDAKVLQESADTYLDDGSYVPTVIRTGWIHTAGLQGFQRIYRLGLLGTYYTDNAFQVRAYYDYSEIPREVALITASDLVNTSVYGADATYGASSVYGGNTLDEVYQASIHLSRQKCESVSFEIRDSAVGTNNSGRGFSLEGIALEVAGIGGIFRTASARRL